MDENCWIICLPQKTYSHLCLATIGTLKIKSTNVTKLSPASAYGPLVDRFFLDVTHLAADELLNRVIKILVISLL